MTLVQFTQELERLREALDHSTSDLAARLDQIDLMVEQKLLSYLYNLMQCQSVYFSRGYEIFRAMKPRMDEMKELVDKIAEEASSTDTRAQCLKEGYLLLQTQQHRRMKKTWARHWFILKDGAFYCKKEGKVMYTTFLGG